MSKNKIRLFAFDLDGTLTQHKTPLSAENRAVLEMLARKFHLCMVGAGMCRRIYEQMGRFPLDIIGNYGMQTALYNAERDVLEIVEDTTVPTDRAIIEKRVTDLRERHGFCHFSGDNVEYHASGCITFPILGTAAAAPDKLAFDPDRAKRRAIYADVCSMFPEYTVFVGGSSSFDIVPRPFNKYYALDRYCQQKGFSHGEVVFVGDDYGMGGNDESVYRSDILFLKTDDYRKFPQIIRRFLEEESL